jgi:hypothetical protein
VTKRELARIFGLSTRTLERYVVAGMPHERWPGRIDFDPEACEAWIRERMTRASSPPPQVGRMLKASCPSCGYLIRLTKKWIAVGLPDCPCGAGALRVDDHHGDRPASRPAVLNERAQGPRHREQP